MEIEILNNLRHYSEVYGNLQFSDSQLNDYAQRINEDFIGQKIPITEEHNANKTAIAWVKPKSAKVVDKTTHKALVVELDELTEKFTELIKNKNYKYNSPEIRKFTKFVGNDKQEASVIDTIAITNQPVIKQLAEMYSTKEKEVFEIYYLSEKMDLTKMLDIAEKSVTTPEQLQLFTLLLDGFPQEERDLLADRINTIIEKAKAPKVEAEEQEVAESVELSTKNQEVILLSNRLAEQEAIIQKMSLEKMFTEELLLSEMNKAGFDKTKKDDVIMFLSQLNTSQIEKFKKLLLSYKTPDTNIFKRMSIADIKDEGSSEFNLSEFRSGLTPDNAGEKTKKLFSLYN